MVNQIIGDSNGDILMLNSGALIKYDIRKERFKELVPVGVGALAALDGEIWCTVRDTLFRYDTDTDSLCFLPKVGCGSVMYGNVGQEDLDRDSKWLYVMEGKKQNVYFLILRYKLFVSSRKELWIASRMKGCIGWQMGRSRRKNTLRNVFVSQQIRGFVEDEWQNVWFGNF